MYASGTSFDVAYFAEPTQGIRRHPALDLSSADDRSRVRFFYIVLCFHNDMILLSITIIDDEAVVCRYYVPTYIYSAFTRCTHIPPASKHLFIFPPRVQTRINILSSRPELIVTMIIGNNNSRHDGAPFLACVKGCNLSAAPSRPSIHTYVCIWRYIDCERPPATNTNRRDAATSRCRTRVLPSKRLYFTKPFYFRIRERKGKVLCGRKKHYFSHIYINRKLYRYKRINDNLLIIKI